MVTDRMCISSEDEGSCSLVHTAWERSTLLSFLGMLVWLFLISFFRVGGSQPFAGVTRVFANPGNISEANPLHRTYVIAVGSIAAAVVCVFSAAYYIIGRWLIWGKQGMD